MVRSVLLWHVDNLCRDIAHGTSLIHEVSRIYIARDRHGVRLHDKMEVTVEHTCHTRRVRQDGEYAGDIQLVDRECDILQGCGILVVGIYLYTGAIVCHKLHIGRDSHVTCQSDMVVLVWSEGSVSQYLFPVCYGHAYAVGLHQRLKPYIYTTPSVAVVNGEIHRRSVRFHLSCQNGLECVLRVVLPVLDTKRVVRVVVVRLHIEAYSIKLQALHLQCVDFHLAVYSRYRRCLYVGVNRGELIPHSLCKPCHCVFCS